MSEATQLVASAILEALGDFLDTGLDGRGEKQAWAAVDRAAAAAIKALRDYKKAMQLRQRQRREIDRKLAAMDKGANCAWCSCRHGTDHDTDCAYAALRKVARS